MKFYCPKRFSKLQYELIRDCFNKNSCVIDLYSECSDNILPYVDRLSRYFEFPLSIKLLAYDESTNCFIYRLIVLSDVPYFEFIED